MPADSAEVLDSELGILKTVEQLAAFNNVARALMSTLDLRELIGIVSQTVAGLVGPMNWSLSLWEPNVGELKVVLATGPGCEAMQGSIVPTEHGIAGLAFETKRPGRVDCVTGDPAVLRRFGATPSGPCSVIVAPLVARGRAHGIIELITEPGASAFTEDDLTRVIGIAEFVAIAIENARNLERVQELTITDEVTGLYNSRHFRALIEEELSRAARFSHPLSLIFVDLDRFKQVNDTHGHLVGTALLREVGQLIRSTMRQVNPSFRYGGDEFALMLIETDIEGAKLFAERLRDAFRGHRFMSSKGLSIEMTASLGVATFPRHAKTGVGLIEAADKAMYVVKSAGRNGVQTAAALPAPG